MYFKIQILLYLAYELFPGKTVRDRTKSIRDKINSHRELHTFYNLDFSKTCFLGFLKTSYTSNGF